VSVLTLAEAHAKRVGLPLNSVHAEFRKKTRDSSFEKDVDLILTSIAEVHYGKDSKLVETRLGDAPTSFFKDARESFKQRGFVEPGDLLLDVTWDFCGMTPIHTVAVTDKKGRPKFEPVLYFGFSIETPVSSSPKQILDDPDLPPWGITNGFGIKCVKAIWSIQPPKFEGCRNPDPPKKSYINERICESSCWLWTEACTQGPHHYTRSTESCSPTGEDCVEIGMHLGFGTGTSTVRLEGTPREWNGIVYDDGDILTTQGVFGYAKNDIYSQYTSCARN
jgi:hypothetical protein